MSILAIRRRHRLSLRQAAVRIGVSHVSVRRWELGLATPTRDHLVSYAALLAVSPQALRRELERRALDRLDRLAVAALAGRYGVSRAS